MRKNFMFLTSALVIAGLAYYGAAIAADAAKTDAAPVAAKSSTLSPDAVVAKVNGNVIKGSDLLELKDGLRPPNNQMPVDAIYNQLQDRLIDGTLVLEAARKAKLADDKEVKERVKKAEDRILQDTFLTREIGRKIDNAKVEERYKKLSGEYKPQTEMKARHILVATEAEAKTIAEQLKKGGDFAKIAKEKSTDKSSAENGGDLGFFTADQVVEPFAKAAFALKDGETSAPVQSQFGWHIIQAQSRRDTKMPALADVKSDIQRMLADEMVAELFSGLRKTAKIEKFGLDGKPVTAAAATSAPAETAPKDKKTQ